MEIIRKIKKKIFFTKKNPYRLNIIGVGPGDPSYLTIAAIDALKKSEVIFYPISGDDKKSNSAEIVREYIKNKKKIPIVFPMARKQFKAQQIWEREAKIIVEFVKRNYSVSLLCLGDTSIYASSFYLKDEIKKNHPEILINTIPGISSFSLAAALVDFQLIKQGETLEIFECPDNDLEFHKSISGKTKRVLVIMKVGRRWEWVKKILKDEDLYEKAFLAVNIGMKNQFIGKANGYLSKELTYFSLLLIRI